MSFFDDDGREWPDDAERCDRCQGMGTEECLCAGDFCCCGAGDNLTCLQCGGEGYFVPSPAFKAAREQNAKWWREFLDRLAAEERTKAESENQPQKGENYEGTRD